jgi:NDP-sugar pyrophosphorylase family protein
MIGAIFAGGYGKRLQSLNPELPKVLLPLKDDFVILDKQLYDFESAGLDEVYLMIGYKGEAIVKRYGTQWNGIKIHYLREKEPMGTLWALSNLFSKVESDILLRNGDTVCDIDLRKFVKYSLFNQKLATIVVVRVRSPFGMVSIDGNIVKKFDEKPFLPFYVNGGTYFLKKEIKSYLKRNFADSGIEGSLFKSLASMGEIAAFRYRGFWKPVDTIKDYEEIRKIFIERKF